MLEILLHAGSDHPNLALILIASGATFLGGWLIGRHSGLLSFLRPSRDPADE